MKIEISHINQIYQITEVIIDLTKYQKHFLFEAPMGAGKTTIIKTICKSLGVKDSISSPTYSIVNEYETSSDKLIYHFDLYRLEQEEELLDIGIDEILASEAICFFEWPKKILNFLPSTYVWVNISLNGGTRVVQIEEVK